MRRKRRAWLVCGGAAAAAAVLYLTWRWLGPDREQSQEQQAREEFQTLTGDLATLRQREQERAAAGSDLATRQAAWNAAKAAWELQRFKAKSPSDSADPDTIKELRNTVARLRRAETQSRDGAVEIEEEDGARLRAYRSEIDGTLQTYSVSIPGAYDPAVSWPLIVSLHGHGWFRPFQGHPATVYGGAFCVAPHGRGATDYMGLGELDVLRVIAEVQRDFAIDPDRVYLSGSSMGGTGGLHLAAHYADRFAGILALAGNADYRSWTRRWGWNQPFPGRRDELRGWLQDSHSASMFAENFLNLPVYVMHGSADTIVPPEHARFMVQSLRQVGATVQYREFPAVGHGGFPDPGVQAGLAWVSGQCRQRTPARVRWRTALLRHGRAYWIRLEQLARPGAFGEIDAQRLDSNHVRISTRNLLAFRVERPAELFDPNLPLFVNVDGERVLFPPRSRSGAWACLRRVPGAGWRDEATLPARSGLRKRPGLEGPISEALRQPFVLVLGTRSPDPLTRKLWQDELESFQQEWERRNLARCPAVRDVDCTETLAATRNLILFGGAADNWASAALADMLPLGEIEALAAAARPADRVAGGGTRLLHQSDVGLSLVYPHPYRAERLVVLLQAGGPPAIYQAWKRFGNWFNWGVFDSKKYFDYAVYDARTSTPETFLLLGYFGTDWSVANGLRFAAVRSERIRLAAQQFPALVQAPTAPDAVALATLRPAHIDQMRGAVGFGRTYHGQPLPNSLGVRAPATLEYELDGTWQTLMVEGRLMNDPHTALCELRRQGESVSFTIRGDGAVLAQGTVNWATPGVALQANLRGVRRLLLETGIAGGPGWLHSAAAWVKPCLTR